MSTNQYKTASASSKGIIISFTNVNKHRYIPYDSDPLISDKEVSTILRYQDITFTSSQQKVYNQVVNGFKAFSKEEIELMDEKKKKNISKKYNRVKLTINTMKQEVLYANVDAMLNRLFPKSRVINIMTSIKDVDRKFNSESFSLKELNITRLQIAQRLVKEKLLPENFFSLK